MMMMGSCCKISWYPIIILNLFVMILNQSFFTSSFSLPLLKNSSNDSNYPSINPFLLDDYLYNYSSKQISDIAHTGVIYNITLPSNFSGMEVSILRLRESRLWNDGVKIGSIDLPSRVLTNPYVKRVGILYEKLGNLPSRYHKLPGYTFVSAIVGIAMYDATDLSEDAALKRLNIDMAGAGAGDVVTVNFGDVRVPMGGNVKHLTCVMFNPSSGNVELSVMTRDNVCSWRALGHYVVAMPGIIGPGSSPDSMGPAASPPFQERGTIHRKRKDHGEWKWWVIGFAAGLVGLGLLVLIGFVCYTTFVSRKIKKMERRSEKSASLGTIWIGNSRMPSASMTRTQASNIENDLSP